MNLSAIYRTSQAAGREIPALGFFDEPGVLFGTQNRLTYRAALGTTEFRLFTNMGDGFRV
jgi:hypothetical protein